MNFTYQSMRKGLKSKSYLYLWISPREVGWKMYLGELYGTDQVPAYAAPARAEDYSNLPYTYTCVGQLDPFRDETITYVAKLAQAGVDVEFHLYPGAYQGFEGINPDAKISQQVLNEYIQA